MKTTTTIKSKMTTLPIAALTAALSFTISTRSHGQESSDVPLTPSVINSQVSIEFSGYATEMSMRLKDWQDYTEPRRFLQHLQTQMSYASNMASKLSGMEAVFQHVPESELRIYALKQMHMAYTDASLDFSVRLKGTDDILAMRPDLSTQVAIDVQEAIRPYFTEWVEVRRKAFEAEIRKVEPDYSLKVAGVETTDYKPEATPEVDAPVEKTPEVDTPKVETSEVNTPVKETDTSRAPLPSNKPSAEERVWESGGKKVTASFVTFVDANTIRLNVSGRHFEFPISRLSKEDQEFLGKPDFKETPVTSSTSKKVSSTKSRPRSSSYPKSSGTSGRRINLGEPTGGSSSYNQEAARREMQNYQNHLNRVLAPRY